MGHILRNVRMKREKIWSEKYTRLSKRLLVSEEGRERGRGECTAGERETHTHTEEEDVQGGKEGDRGRCGGDIACQRRRRRIACTCACRHYRPVR